MPCFLDAAFYFGRWQALRGRGAILNQPEVLGPDWVPLGFLLLQQREAANPASAHAALGPSARHHR